MDIKPIGKRVLVDVIEQEEKTTSGIILIQKNERKNYSLGKIVSLSDDPEILNLFSIDEIIIFKKDVGIEINSDFKNFILINLNDVLAKKKN